MEININAQLSYTFNSRSRSILIRKIVLIDATGKQRAYMMNRFFSSEYILFFKDNKNGDE